jgi:citrate lyase subunit gamma (acyl carrier protein)
MRVIRRTASAGTLESSDCLVTVSPGDDGVEVELRGNNRALFLERTEGIVRKVLNREGERSARVLVQDQGALALVLEARTATAVERAGREEA